jgi:membrane-associated protease RseP (regulator of RpoE activity)
MNILVSAAAVLLCVVGLALSVGLHELGHLIPGKLFNVKVTQYFIGFGRTLWSRRRGETEYGVKAIPLGGYVKLVGMLPPAADEEPGKVRASRTGMFQQLVSDARSAEYEDVGPHDHGRLFYQLPWWKRVIVWGAGVTINVVLAFLLFAAVFMGYGALTPTTTVSSVSECVQVVSAQQKPGPCTASDPVTPAREAGLRPGDRILRFNGQEIGAYAQLQRLIRANGDDAFTLTVERAGRELTLHAHSVVNQLPALGDARGSDKTVEAGFLGITPTLEVQRKSAGYVVTTMVDGTKEVLETIGKLPVKVYHVGRAALGLEERADDSPMSVVGAGRIVGEVGASDQGTLASKFFFVLSVLAGLNLFLGLINLVPLPPFDGAGVATSLYDALRRGSARVLRRPAPGPVDSAKLLPLSYAMAVVIMVVSVVLVVADVVAPVTL